MNIFVNDSSFFAAPYLAEAIGCDLYVLNMAKNNFFGDDVPMGKYAGEAGENIPAGDITLIGVKSLEVILPRIAAGHFNRVNFIISDTDACRKYQWWNRIVSDYGIRLYAMPDLFGFCLSPCTEIYHYMRVNPALIEPKPDRILVSHSPRAGHKAKVKGTAQIIETVEGLKKTLDFDFVLITGLTQPEAVRLKSRSHIFIDQLIYDNPHTDQNHFGGKIVYNGGIGKSGIEALHCGAAVITGGIAGMTPPPIKYTDYYNFENDLAGMITGGYKNQIPLQNEWLANYNVKNLFA